MCDILHAPILIVDDKPANISWLESMLCTAGSRGEFSQNIGQIDC
jgi:CheY-like chemotaxis protein